MSKIKVAVIGCSGVGVLHAEGVTGSDAELVAGCDISEETLHAFGESGRRRWPDLALYTDYRQMLQKEKPDIVTVATSDNRHAEMVVDAVGAGARGIYCEKPLATSLADADRMVAACDAGNVVLSVDHTRRFMPLWQRMKSEYVHGGRIGDLQYIVGTLSGERASIFRNGTHLIDALCFLADSPPAWVFAELEPGYEDYTEYRGDGGRTPALEPSVSGYIHFANGVRAFYTGTSKRTAGPKWHFEIVGSEGVIRIGKQATINVGNSSEVIEPEPVHNEAISAGLGELIDVVANGGQVSSPGSEARAVVEVIFGFLESQRQGNTRVELPLPR